MSFFIDVLAALESESEGMLRLWRRRWSLVLWRIFYLWVWTEKLRAQLQDLSFRDVSLRKINVSNCLKNQQNNIQSLNQTVDGDEVV